MRVTWAAVEVGVRVESTGPPGWPGERWEASSGRRPALAGQPHQEGGAHPDEGGHSMEVGALAQQPELTLPDAFHLLQEAGLPGVQLQHLDATEDLTHQLDARVFELHLLYL